MRGRRAVELSVHSLIGLLERDHLGDPHPVLAGGERYVSPRVAGERLRRELSSAGLDDRDRLDELRAAVTVVQRATTEYYGWITTGTESWSTVTAAIGRAATALTRVGDRVSVRRVDSARLVELVVRQLPDTRGGHGESITVRAADLATRPAGVLRRPGSARPEGARRLDALLRAPRLAGATLYAARRDDAGNRARAREWLTVLDLADGRWLVYATQGRGERAINARPAGADVVAAELTELHRSARPGRAR